MNAPETSALASRAAPAARLISPARIAWVVGGLLVPAVIALGLAKTNELVVGVLILGVLGLLLIAAQPFWGLVFFIALVYTRPEDTFSSLQGMQLTLLVSALTLISTIVQMLVNRERAVRAPSLGLLLGFLAMGMVSTLKDGEPIQAAQDLGKLVILTFLTLNLVRTPERYRIFCVTLILFSAFQAASSIHIYYSGGALMENGILRTQGIGIFGNPNDLATALVAGFALALGQMAMPQNTRRWLLAPPLVLIVWAILLTNSRGGLLAMMVTMGSAFLLFSRSKGKATTYAILSAMLLLSLASGRMKNFDHKESSANSRIECWANGLSMLKEHPLTGIGYLKFPEMNDGFNAHNIFVICFTELGLPGYFFWIGCIYYSYRKIPPEKQPSCSPAAQRELSGARLALSSYLVAGFFGNYTYMPITYLLLALPLVQQFASSGQTEIFQLTPAERARDAGRIALICIVSIVLIKVVVPRLM